MTDDMTDLGAWAGREVERSETISATPMSLLASTLGCALPEDGDVPPLWHWLYFLPNTPTSELGEDGHEKRGAFFPAVKLRRRMFGGGEITIHRSLRVGELAVRRSRITATREKSGQSGPLVLVDVLHEIEGQEGLAVSDSQVIVYTDSRPAALVEPGLPPDAEWKDAFITSPAVIFRFSALTFNAHRIHYDVEYATATEKYPRLVVQGPLVAILLAELARSRGMDLNNFKYRTRAPLYVGDRIHLRGTPRVNGVRLEAYCGSHLAIEAYGQGPLE